MVKNRMTPGAVEYASILKWMDTAIQALQQGGYVALAAEGRAHRDRLKTATQKGRK